jgi:PAS domain S-box-containing protein
MGSSAHGTRGAERLFGYSAREAIGKPVTILIPPELLDEEQRILATLRRGERIEHYETIRLTKDRRRVHISLTVSPVRDESGAIIGASKIARDITDRKRAEILLREAHTDLQSRITELARFNVAAVDRESRILALKREVNLLRARLGEAAEYSFDGAEKENRPPGLAYSREPAPGESSRPTAGITSLDSILITEQLQRRTSRPTDREAENRALGTLVQALADAPDTILP